MNDVLRSHLGEESPSARPSPPTDLLRRRDLLAGVAASLPVLAQGRRQPNIVFIMADDLGWGDVGCYGQKIIRTPNIDTLAREGTRYTNAYSGCTVCAPSRSVLMTGKHMGHTAVRSNPGGVPLPPSEVTVAEVLKQAGYATGCFGKWGLGDIGTEGMPWKQGFDEFAGPLSQVHAHFHYPNYIFHNDRKLELEGNANLGRKTYAHDVIVGKALEFIRRSKDRPFFCYMPVTLPHWELLVPEDSMAPYRGVVEERGPYVDKTNHYASQQAPRAAYAGMVSRMDRDVGRVTSLLKELALERNTLVVFTSDNGGALRLLNDDYFQSCGPFRGHKQNFYEGGIRIPMIARWPGRVAAGKVSDFAWMFHDVLPTLADVAGEKAPSGVDGMSVLPTLLGKPQKPHEWLYWELPRYVGATGEFRKETPMQALRMGDWKAVRPQPDSPVELYNLATDPAESSDVSSANPAVMKRVQEILRTARTEPQRQTQPPHDFAGPQKP